MPKRWIKPLGAALVLGLVSVSCGDSGGLQADAGSDFSVNVGDSPTFDGCGSSGDINNYGWVIVEAPGIMASDAGKPIRELDADCSFDLEAAMVGDEVGTWVVELTVTDADGNTSMDTVTVKVEQ